jgi:hypothetical protein
MATYNVAFIVACIQRQTQRSLTPGRFAKLCAFSRANYSIGFSTFHTLFATILCPSTFG